MYLYIPKTTRELRYKLDKRRKNVRLMPEGYEKEIYLPGYAAKSQSFGFEHRGLCFTANIKWIFDESPDESWLGSFSNNWEEGCIDRKFALGSLPRNSYRYWHPTNTLESHWKSYKESNYACRHECWGLARSHVIDDWRTHEKITDGDICCLGCVVNIYHQGEEVAHDSCFGYYWESHKDNEFLIERQEEHFNIARDQINDGVIAAIHLKEAGKILGQQLTINQRAFSQ